MAPLTTGFSVDRWSGAEAPTALEMEQRLRAEGFRPYRTVDPPGTSLRSSPGTREVRWLLSGRLRVRLEGSHEPLVLAPGDRLEVAPGFAHEIEVWGDEPAVLVAAVDEPVH